MLLINSFVGREINILFNISFFNINLNCGIDDNKRLWKIIGKIFEMVGF